MGLTQAELARLAGTSQPNVSDYECDRVSPTVEVAERLLAALGKELTVLRCRRRLIVARWSWPASTQSAWLRIRSE